MKYLNSASYRGKIDKLPEKPFQVTNLIYKMPMTKMSVASKGIFLLDGDQFFVKDYENLHIKELYQLVKEICEYRLQVYFEKRADR